MWAVAQWQAQRIAALEKRLGELETLLAKALKNSSTSSKPPSSDIVKPPKPPPNTPGGKRKVGGQRGHAKISRLPFDAASVTAVHAHTLDGCPDCHGPLRRLRDRPRTVQQVEVVAAPLRVEEHRGPFLDMVFPSAVIHGIQGIAVARLGRVVGGVREGV